MARDVRNSIIASIACAAALAPLAILAYSVSPTARIDAAILRRLADPEGTPGYSVAWSIAHLADLLPLVAMLAVCVAIGLAVGRSRQVIAAVAIVAGANLTTQILKHLLSHPRFQVDFAGLHQPWSDAFPSGHTTAAASIGVALMLVVPPRTRPLAAVAAAGFLVAVGFSVVVMQWHYPSDVLGALCVVGSWTFAALAGLALTRPKNPASPPRARPPRRVVVSLE